MAMLPNSRAIALIFLALIMFSSVESADSQQLPFGLTPALMPHFAPGSPVWPRNSFNRSSINLLVENVSPNCLYNSLMYIKQISNLFMPNSTRIEGWALKMIDASAKIPTGILEGNLKWLGSFSECLKINNEGMFSGQYCTATIADRSSESQTMGWESVLQVSDTGVNLINCSCVSVGFCWPSTCTEKEIQTLIDNISLPLSIQPGSCQVDNPNVYDSSTIAVIVIYCVFAMILLIGTVVDVFLVPRKVVTSESPNENLKPGILRNFLTSFSVIKNGKKLLNTKSGGETLTCIQGIRLISMFWVILGHTYDYASMMAIKNPIDVYSSLKSVAFNVILNGTYSVDTFLFLSGFLITYLGLKQLKKTGGRLNILLYYFHRYWRLTPLYAMVIALIAGPYYLLGSGPQWQSMLRSQENCRTYWWRNLLYINNLYDTAHMCVDVSWYISIDMQYYLIMPLVLIPLYKLPLLGFGIVAILFVITTVTPALYIHYHDIPGYPGLQILFGGSSPKSIDFQSNVYIKPYCRMGPYLVGVCLGYFLFKKELRVKLSWWKNLIGWVLALGLGLTLIYGTCDYFNGEKVMSNALNSVYGALSRTAWGLCVAWVVFVCVTGNGGFVNTLLSWKGMVPLGRLTYCGYLIHLNIILLLLNTQEVAYYYQQYLMVILYCGFLVMVMAVSFVFSIAFEAPTMELEKALFPWSAQKKKSRGSSRKSIERNRQRISEPMEEIGEIVCQEIDKVQQSSYQNGAYVVTEEEGMGAPSHNASTSRSQGK